MNELLKEKAETIIKNNKKYFIDLKDLDTITSYLCDSLSSFGYYNTCNEIIENELFDIFMYLYNKDKELLEMIITNQNTKTNLYKETLKIINELISCETNTEGLYLYNDIIEICNTMTQKLYNISYEEFLVNYIK